MSLTNILAIKIPETKTECKIKDSEVYYLKKVRFQEQNIIAFFAALSAEFVRVVGSGRFNGRYETQLGHITCDKGWIDFVRVNDGEEPGELDARNCGISSVLTALCMVDPELNTLPRTAIDTKFRHHYKLGKKMRRGAVNLSD